MVVRLKTEGGKIKAYGTIYEVGHAIQDLYFHDKWVANCGREWKNKPEPDEECDHLECAIYLAEKQRKNGSPQVFMVCIAMIAIGSIMDVYMIDLRLGLILFGFFTLFAFGVLIGGYRAGKRLDELNEFKDKGTINGISAWRILDDP